MSDDLLISYVNLQQGCMKATVACPEEGPPTLHLCVFRNPGEQDGEALPMGSSVDMLSTLNPDLEEADSLNTPIYEKYDSLLHGGTRNRK
jgi:hypothetical protein